MPATSETQRARIAKLMSDPRYWNKTDPEHPRVFADAQRAFRDAYPEPPPEGQITPGTVHVRAYTRTQDGKPIDVSAYDRRQEIAFHPAAPARTDLPKHLQEIAEGPIHRQGKAKIVERLQAHGDTVETEVSLVSINGVPVRVDIFGMTPDGFLYAIEIKTTAYDLFSQNQINVYPMLDLGNHVYSTSPRIRSFGFEPGQLLPPICLYGMLSAPGKLIRRPLVLSSDPTCQPSSYRKR